MKLLEFQRERKKSTSVAKERLQIIVAHQRSQRGQPDYMPLLERELLEVIRRYVRMTTPFKFRYSEDNCSVLELNVTLPKS